MFLRFDPRCFEKLRSGGDVVEVFERSGAPCNAAVRLRPAFDSREKQIARLTHAPCSLTRPAGDRSLAHGAGILCGQPPVDTFLVVNVQTGQRLHDVAEHKLIEADAASALLSKTCGT